MWFDREGKVFSIERNTIGYDTEPATRNLVDALFKELVDSQTKNVTAEITCTNGRTPDGEKRSPTSIAFKFKDREVRLEHVDSKPNTKEDYVQLHMTLHPFERFDWEKK